MTYWVVDDGPFGDLARLFDQAWSWPASTLHVLSEVARAARQDKSGRRASLLAMSAAGVPAVEVHDIQVGSPAAEMLYGHLRRNSANASEDLGEHASIAFCAMEAPHAVFVAADKQAAFLALAELGPGKVASPCDLWAELSTARLITDEQYRRLTEQTVRNSALPGIPRRLSAGRRPGAAANTP